MSRRVALLALVAAAALSGCQTVRDLPDRLWPFGRGGEAARSAPEDGRVSILALDQQLAADPALAGAPLRLPAAQPLEAWASPGGSLTNAVGNIQASGLTIAWRRGVGAGGSERQPITASPVGADGRIYVLDAGQTVRAVSAATGASLWSASVRPTERRRNRDQDAFGGGLTLDGGSLFVATGFGEVVALDAATGAQKWRAKAASPFHAAPVASAGRVFVTSNDSELFAFDAFTGEELWSFQAIAEPARMLASPSPALSGDVVIAPFASGEVVSLLVTNGRRLWGDALTRAGRLTSLSAINDIAGRPVAAGGVVYAVSQSGVLAAIDQRTGERLWARILASVQTPWLAGEQIFVVTTDSELVCLERSNGAVRWVAQLPRFEDEKDREGRIAWAGPIMVNGELVLTSTDGRIAFARPEDGAISRTLNAGDAVFLPPIAMGGSVYVLTRGADLIALR